MILSWSGLLGLVANFRADNFMLTIKIVSCKYIVKLP